MLHYQTRLAGWAPSVGGRMAARFFSVKPLDAASPAASGAVSHRFERAEIAAVPAPIAERPWILRRSKGHSVSEIAEESVINSAIDGSDRWYSSKATAIAPVGCSRIRKASRTRHEALRNARSRRTWHIFAVHVLIPGTRAFCETGTVASGEFLDCCHDLGADDLACGRADMRVVCFGFAETSARVFSKLDIFPGPTVFSWSCAVGDNWNARLEIGSSRAWRPSNREVPRHCPNAELAAPRPSTFAATYDRCHARLTA